MRRMHLILYIQKKKRFEFSVSKMFFYVCVYNKTAGQFEQVLLMQLGFPEFPNTNIAFFATLQQHLQRCNTNIQRELRDPSVWVGIAATK